MNQSRVANLSGRGALLLALLLIVESCSSPQPSQASPSPSAGSSQSGSLANLVPTPASAWVRAPGGFQLSHTFPTHPYPLLLSPPIADAHSGDAFVLATDTTFRPTLGRWHQGQWAFSSPPARFTAMAYDSARHQVIAVAAAEGVIGASSSFETAGSDSWGWDGSMWQKLSLGVSVAFGMFPGDTLFYDSSTQSLELVSVGATDSGYEAYARSELGPQGNWQMIECGTGYWPDTTTVGPCGLPTKVGVPTPFPWLFSSSPDGSPPALLGPGGILGYDARLHSVIGYQQLNNGTSRLLAFSSGSWQPIKSAAPNVPFGFWSGAYDSSHQTLWIAGHTPDGAFHLYKDDVADGFRDVTLTQSPTGASAIATGAGAEADKLTNGIASEAWSQSLAYEPSSQELLWLEYGDPKWSPGPFQDCCIGATVTLQVSSWTFTTGAVNPLPLTGPSTAPSNSGPSDLSFPFPQGSTYINTGPHSFNTNCQYLNDCTPTNGAGPTSHWGGMDFYATANDGTVLDHQAVVAAHDGIVRWSPPCAGGSVLEINHLDSKGKPDGWATIYYHLQDIPSAIVDGARISRGTVIGYTGRAIPCGGYAPIAHVHFSLYHATAPFDPGIGNAASEWYLDGLCMGGWTVHSDNLHAYAGGSLSRPGSGVLYSWDPLTNDGWVGCSPPVGDACVIGHWTEQVSQTRINFGLGAVPVNGPSGVSWTISADGKETIDPDQADTWVGTDGFGNQWKELWRGTATYTVHASAKDGLWKATLIISTVTAQVLENGLATGVPLGAVSPVNWSSTPKYACSSSQLVLEDSSGKPVYTLIRAT